MTYPAPEPSDPNLPQGYGPPVSMPKATPDQRQASLAQAVGFNVSRGARVESQTPYQAVLVFGNRTNHVLHAIITFFTCGIWGFVWLILGVTNKEQRRVLSVDEYGQILQH